MIKIELQGINNVVARLSDIEKKLSDENMKALNAQRGEAFAQFVREGVQGGTLGMDPISPMREDLSNGPHLPMLNTGEVMETLEVRSYNRWSVVGFLSNGKARKIPSYMSELTAKKTVAQIVQMQHVLSGFRIKVTAKMRKWMAWQDVFFSPKKEFIQFKPRPFVYNALSQWLSGNRDLEIVSKFLKGL